MTKAKLWFILALALAVLFFILAASINPLRETLHSANQKLHKMTKLKQNILV